MHLSHFSLLLPLRSPQPPLPPRAPLSPSISIPFPTITNVPSADLLLQAIVTAVNGANVTLNELPVPLPPQNATADRCGEALSRREK